MRLTQPPLSSPTGAATPAQAGRAAARSALRAATHDAHERLHRAPGLAALAAGTLSRPDYAALLLRLLGLHAPLEARMARHAGRPGFAWRSAAPDRAARLRQDLLDLGLPAPCVAAAPCAARHLPTLDHPAAALGGAWVIEGSALGGGVLARRLDAVLAPGEPGGRAFFTPDPQQPARWRACCAAVEACGADPEGLAQMQHAARDTFAAFEIWLGAP